MIRPASIVSIRSAVLLAAVCFSAHTASAQGVEIAGGGAPHAADPAEGVVVDIYASHSQDVSRVENYGGQTSERIVSGGPDVRLSGYDHRPGYVSYSSTVVRYPYADYPGYGYDPQAVGNGSYGPSGWPIGFGVITPRHHGQAWAGYSYNQLPYFYTAPNYGPASAGYPLPGYQGPYVYYYHRPRMPAYYHGYYYYASPVIHSGLVPSPTYLETAP